MCGIGGFFLKNTPSRPVPEVLQTFSQGMKHRGPDDEGFVLFNADYEPRQFGSLDTHPDWFELSAQHRPISEALMSSWIGGLVHRRLSIMDLSVLAHQPYPSSRHSWLTFNGEIYNYPSLLPDFHPNSDSDTAVLVEFLERGGLQKLSKLDGMFALAWLSPSSGQLTLARDRMGVKPLYYLDTPDFFAFASEPTTLHHLLQQNPNPNPSLLAEYLSRGIVVYDGPGFWEPVKELLPGYQLCYSLKDGYFELKKWFNASLLEVFPPVEARRRLKDTLNQSVSLRLRSDVPVGCSLSGGLDSGLVTALAKKHLPNQNILAFTATWPGQPENEARLAKIAADFIGVKWVEVPLETQKLEEYWSEVTRFQGFPLIHTSTMAQGKVMETASAYGIKVMLDGQGGDELFAGYSHHAKVYNQSFKYLIMSLLEDFILQLSSSYRFYRHPLSQCWKGNLPPGLPISTYRHERSLKELLQHEAYGQSLKNLFRWADRSGMAYGIESRFPLADSIQLQEVAFSLAASDLIDHGWSKLALRRMAQGVLPDEVVWNQAKSAYGSPQHHWVKNNYPQWLSELHPQMSDILDVAKLKILASKMISSGKSDGLFRVKALSEWMKQFVS